MLCIGNVHSFPIDQLTNYEENEEEILLIDTDGINVQLDD